MSNHDAAEKMIKWTVWLGCLFVFCGVIASTIGIAVVVIHFIMKFW